MKIEVKIKNCKCVAVMPGVCFFTDGFDGRCKCECHYRVINARARANFDGITLKK